MSNEFQMDDTRPSPGVYMSDPEEYRLAFTEKVWPDGREEYHLVGLVFSQDGEQANLDLGLSPHARKEPVFEDGKPKKDENGETILSKKDDTRTRRWREAAEMFEGARGELPKTNADLVAFLMDTPFQVQLFHSPSSHFKYYFTDLNRVGAKARRRG